VASNTFLYVELWAVIVRELVSSESILGDIIMKAAEKTDLNGRRRLGVPPYLSSLQPSEHDCGPADFPKFGVEYFLVETRVGYRWGVPANE
jgi:hypothetical protein